MCMLERKLRRDIWRLKGQVATIALVLACGIMALVMLRSAYGSLLLARDDYYARYRFGDVFSHLERAPDAVATRLEALPGVALVYPRIVKDVMVPIADEPDPVTGTLISLPDVGEPPLGQLYLRSGRLPDAVAACVGGGSNAIGIFHAFLDDPSVRLYGFEAAGDGIDTERHAASIERGRPGILHGARSFLLQDEDGQTIESHSISAGLDYPGVGPEHAFLPDSRVTFARTDPRVPAADRFRAGPWQAGPVTEPAARIRDLVKTYGSGDALVRALDGVSLDLEAGQFTAIMGPSGSGKSTLMHCAAALDRADSGTVHIGDQELGRLGDRALTRLRRDRIGFVFQAYNLVPTLTALENITLPLDIAGRKPDRQWLDTVVMSLGLRDRLHHRPGELSGGQQQRVAVARALASQPEIVFGDEPTGNLDSRTSDEVLSMLRNCVDELGQTVVIVTHDPRAAGYSDRVLFLADGRIGDELRSPTAEAVLDRMKGLDR